MADKLIIPESPHQILPSLAAEIGINETLFIQQLHYLMVENDCFVYENRYWWKHTNAQWLEKMPYFSEPTLKRVISSLKKKKILLVDQLTWKILEERGDRTNWYTIDYDKVAEISKPILAKIEKKRLEKAKEKTAKAAKKSFSPDFNKKTTPSTSTAIENSGTDQIDLMVSSKKSAVDQIPSKNTENRPVGQAAHGIDQNDLMRRDQFDPMSSDQTDPMLYKNNKKELFSSSKPEQTQGADNSFDLDLVITWILSKLGKVYELSASDEIFVEASLEEYHESAIKPRKAQAFTWVEQGLKNRMAVERRSMKASVARDKKLDATVGLLQKQAENLNQQAKRARPQTTAEKLQDTEWQDDDIFAEIDRTFMT